MVAAFKSEVKQVKSKCTLNGFIAEDRFRVVLSNTKFVKSASFSNGELNRVAMKWQGKYKTVSHYLYREGWGNWLSSPTSILLDKFFKSDVVFQYKGWTVSLDITTNCNIEELSRKKREICALDWAYQELGICKQSIVCMTSDTIDPIKLVRILDKVIKSDEGNVEVYFI